MCLQLYGRLFDWLVARANASICPDEGFAAEGDEDEAKGAQVTIIIIIINRTRGQGRTGRGRGLHRHHLPPPSQSS
jgi:hypothetical protein